MSDCLNVEIRELLPDYPGGTLSASRRPEVDAHVASCAECADELALLRLVREAYAESPAVNVKAIVAALPRNAARPAMRTVRAGAPLVAPGVAVRLSRSRRRCRSSRSEAFRSRLRDPSSTAIPPRSRQIRWLR